MPGHVQPKLPTRLGCDNLGCVEVDPSARKHGVPEADIHHAVRMSIRAIRQGGDRVLFIGPRRDGPLLEVVVLDALDDDEPAVAIHAMPLRPKFEKYLR